MRHGLMDLRFLPALLGGCIIATALFLLMHHLIANNQQQAPSGEQANTVNFVQVQKQQQVRKKTYAHPKKPPPSKGPQPDEKEVVSGRQQLHALLLPTNLKLSSNSLGSGTGVYIGQSGPQTNSQGYAPLTPMVRIKPIYPPQAQYQGVEGTVTTCFTVEPDGSVANPHVKGASSPQARRMLGQAALRTILQWKFFPKKVNGSPVSTKDVCQDIQFTLHGQGH